MKTYTFGILVKFGRLDSATGFIDWDVTDEQDDIIQKAMEEGLDFRNVPELGDLYAEIEEEAFDQEFYNYNEFLDEEEEITREEFENYFCWVHFIDPDELSSYY